MKKQVLVYVMGKGIRESIQELLYGISETLRVRFVYDSSEAYKILMEHNIDIIICGGTTTGADFLEASFYAFAEAVRKVPRYYIVPIIFISNVEDPTNYCYRELHCFDVLEYPICRQRFVHTVQKALHLHVAPQEERIIYVKEDNVLYPISCQEISYVQSVNHVTEFLLQNGSRRRAPYVTLQQLLDIADVSFLLQCARNVVINIKCINNIDFSNRIVTMKDCARLPIGPRYLKNLQEHFKMCRQDSRV